MNPRALSTIVDRKRYDTQHAELLAGDDFWDGHNYERRGRQRFLYRTKRGAFLLATLTQWEGERDSLEVVDEARALQLWEELSERRVSFGEAFPGLELEEG